MYLLISIYLLALYHCTISKLQFTKLCQMMSLSNHYRLSIHGATRIVSPMVSGPANDVPEVWSGVANWPKRESMMQRPGLILEMVFTGSLHLRPNYHLVMTNIAMENPNHKWRFLAGKIIYKWAIFHGELLNNQRVSPKCSRFQSNLQRMLTKYVEVSLMIFFLFSSGNSAGSGWLRAVGRRSLEGTSEVKRRLAQMFLWFWVHRNDRKDTVKLQYPTINEWWFFHLFYLGVTIYIIYS